VLPQLQILEARCDVEQRPPKLPVSYAQLLSPGTYNPLPGADFPSKTSEHSALNHASVDPSDTVPLTGPPLESIALTVTGNRADAGFTTVTPRQSQGQAFKRQAQAPSLLPWTID